METTGRVVFGAAFVVVGLGIGTLMFSHPEGTNPAWGPWMAALAPAVFVMGGVFLVADALGFPRFAAHFLRALLFAFLAMANWIAFFVTDLRCTESLSFLGIELLRRHPDVQTCRITLMIFVGTIDAIVVFSVGIRRWRQWRGRRDADA